MSKKEIIKGNIFYNEDCISGCERHIPNNSIDLIITDPPYGINGESLHKHYHRDESYVVDGYIEVPAEEYGDFSHKWIKQAERILKPGGQIYIVSGYTNLYHILDALRNTGLKEINHIIWKYNFGVFTKTKYVSSHYHILYYEKPGKKKRKFNLPCRYGMQEKDENGGSLNYQDREDVWIINREYKPGKKKNKNELPTTLLIKMMQYSSDKGDTVCDLFLGGFSTAKVAIGLNRKSIGFELSYLFSWDDVPGDDSGRLLKFLEKDIGIEWAKNAKIKKSNNDKTITITKGTNTLPLKLNKKENKVILKIGGGETHEYILKEEDGKLNIYKKDTIQLF